MKIYLQALVFLLLAVPFVYMLYDVLRDLLLQTLRVIKRKAGPVLTSFLSSYSK